MVLTVPIKVRFDSPFVLQHTPLVPTTKVLFRQETRRTHLSYSTFQSQSRTKLYTNTECIWMRCWIFQTPPGHCRWRKGIFSFALLYSLKLIPTSLEKFKEVRTVLQAMGNSKRKAFSSPAGVLELRVPWQQFPWQHFFRVANIFACTLKPKYRRRELKCKARSHDSLDKESANLLIGTLHFLFTYRDRDYSSATENFLSPLRTIDRKLIQYFALPTSVKDVDDKPENDERVRQRINLEHQHTTFFHLL